MAIVSAVVAISALLVSFAALLYKPVTLRAEVVGFTRPLDKIQNVHGQDFRLIPDTLYCEDLHYHESSNLLFGASEEKPGSRWKWFPPFVEFTIHLNLMVYRLQLLFILHSLIRRSVSANSTSRMLWIGVLLS